MCDRRVFAAMVDLPTHLGEASDRTRPCGPSRSNQSNPLARQPALYAEETPANTNNLCPPWGVPERIACIGAPHGRVEPHQPRGLQAADNHRWGERPRVAAGA